MYKYNPVTQKMMDIDAASENHWLRIYSKSGKVFEGYADCWTYTTIGDDEDEDVDAIRFIRRDGTGYAVAVANVNRFEILEPR